MHRLVVLCFLISLILLLGAATASAAPTTTATATYTLTGSVAAGVTSAEIGDPATFVFTMKNVGTTTGAERFLVITKVTGATDVHQGCIFRGFEFNPDGHNCEPGALKPGQSSSAFVQVVLASATSGVTVRACVVNSSNGASGPCMTLTVANPG